MTLFITSENVAQYAQVGGSKNYGDREKVVLLWDELDRSDKRLAKNIDIDLEVQTEDPSNVPKKWKDCTVKIGNKMDTTDMIKLIIANPSRFEVWEMLQDQDPSEPLILWWLDKTFNDEEYMRLLADACFYGLFKGDKRYLWAVVAFGVDGGVGRFNWPESQKDSKEIKSVKKKAMEQWGLRKKELELAWDDLKGQLGMELEDITEEEIDALGIGREKRPDSEPSDDNEVMQDDGQASSLLDF